jgi:hypothetical protein
MCTLLFSDEPPTRDPAGDSGASLAFGGGLEDNSSNDSADPKGMIDDDRIPA